MEDLTQEEYDILTANEAEESTQTEAPETEAPEAEAPEAEAPETPTIEPENAVEEDTATEQDTGQQRDSSEEQARKLTIALRKEREELRALKGQLGIVDELKKEILALKTPKEEVPSFDDDPLEALRKGQEEINKKFTETEQKTSDQIQQTQIEHLKRLAQLSETNFKSQNPDYDAARQYLIDFRVKELNNIGITDEAEIEGIVNNQLGQAIYISMTKGKDPATTLYNLARQFGYKKVNQEAIDKGKQTLETVEKGQKAAATTLSGGGDEKPKTTVESLLNAEGEEFDRMWNEMFKR